MPGPYLYPGIYVEEVPSGVHPIIGVATSDTAFVDYFTRGPVNEPTRVTSFAEFERVFGGLDPHSEASYAVLQYFANGGQNAWIVRAAVGNPGSARFAFTHGNDEQLVVTAASPGAWGNDVQVTAVAAPSLPPPGGTGGVPAGSPPTGSPPAGSPPGGGAGAAGPRFNLFIRETRVVDGQRVPVATEEFRDVTTARDDPRYVVAVARASKLVTLAEAPDVLGPQLDLEPATVTGEPLEDATHRPFHPLSGGTDGDFVTGNLSGLAAALEEGFTQLDRIDPFVFNLLCLPSATVLDEAGQRAVLAQAQTYCESRRAFLLVDPPPAGDDERPIDDAASMQAWLQRVGGLPSANAAVYFPRLEIFDPLTGRTRPVGPSGTLAGVYARTDAERGVWKASAGAAASLRGATLRPRLTDLENGRLNPLGVNALRDLPVFGPVAWGARTLFGADQRASEWKYVPVRRTALYIEQSLVQGLRWVVFEGNDEPLWSQIRLNVGSFMQGLFLQGAFQGTTPREAYLVKCDKTTTTQDDIDRGVVNILVGFAPLKPAEFVVIRIQQLAGQAQA